MPVSVVLDDKVSDGAGDCKCCLGDGPDDVEFAGMFINNVDGVGISARRCVWELVYVEIENGTWGSGWCRCGWGILGIVVRSFSRQGNAHMDRGGFDLDEHQGM